MTLPITGIYQLLDLLRDRPGMYGVGGKSFSRLQSFLAGLSYGNLDAGDPPIWDFDWWSTVRTHHIGTSMPWYWLTQEQSDEQAYATWFALLDEYRACRIVELARLPGDVVRFSKHWRAEPGQPHVPFVPPTPRFVRVGQFAPSNVFFAELVYGDDRDEKLIDGFQPALGTTVAAAQAHWKVDPAAWTFSP